MSVLPPNNGHGATTAASPFCAAKPGHSGWVKRTAGSVRLALRVVLTENIRLRTNYAQTIVLNLGMGVPARTIDAHNTIRAKGCSPLPSLSVASLGKMFPKNAIAKAGSQTTKRKIRYQN